MNRPKFDAPSPDSRQTSIQSPGLLFFPILLSSLLLVFLLRYTNNYKQQPDKPAQKLDARRSGKPKEKSKSQAAIAASWQ